MMSRFFEYLIWVVSRCGFGEVAGPSDDLADSQIVDVAVEVACWRAGYAVPPYL